MGCCCSKSVVINNVDENKEENAHVPSPLGAMHPLNHGDIKNTLPNKAKSNTSTIATSVAALSSKEVIVEEIQPIVLHDSNRAVSESSSAKEFNAERVEKSNDKNSNEIKWKEMQQGTKKLSTSRRFSSNYDPRNSINGESIELSHLNVDVSNNLGKNKTNSAIFSPVFQSMSERYTKSRLLRVVPDEYQFDLHDQDSSNTNEIQSPKPILIKQKQIRQMGKEALKNLITLQSFMKHLKEFDTEIHYSIVIDASASMFNEKYYDNKKMEFDQRWKAAQKLLETIIPKIADCCVNAGDSNQRKGATVYFFSDEYSKHSNVQTAEDVKNLFHSKTNKLRGQTKLACVLQEILNTAKNRSEGGNVCGECVLVVTDGRPDDLTTVKQILHNSNSSDNNNNHQSSSTSSLLADQETQLDGTVNNPIITASLSISVVVMGNDTEAESEDSWLMETALLAKPSVHMDGFSFGSVDVAEVMRRVFY